MDHNNIDKGSMAFILDIGTRSVVGLLGSYVDKKIVIHHSAYEFHQSRAMYDGQIHDIDEVVSIAKKIKEQLEEKAGFPLKEVAIAAAGRALKTYRVTMEKELDENKNIDRHLVNSIEIEGLQKAQKELETNDNENTNYFCVGHTVINYLLNDGIIGNPVGHRGKRLKMDILATFLPHLVVDSLNTVMNKVGLEVSYMTLEPIAAIEVAVPHNVRLLNIAMVDIGAGTSDIAITKDGSVVAYAMTSTAGDEITETIAKTYLLDFDTAEKVKCQLCKKTEQEFTDILGLPHRIATESMLEAIAPAIETIAKGIASNIIEQNEKAPSAIFLIGGGSQIPGLAEMVANLLAMPKERVAVRGTEIIQNLSNKGNLVFTGPEGITPVGILAKAIENKTKDFIEINLNGKDIKLFQSRKLKVSDGLVFMGYNPRDLIPKRGNPIKIIINQLVKTIYGEYGHPAEIMVNRQKANLDTPIKNGDAITIIPAKAGKDASVYLQDFLSLDQTVNLNGKAVSFILDICINGEVPSGNPLLKDEDAINYLQITTVAGLLDYYNIDYHGKIITINGKEGNLNDVIKANDHIFINDEDCQKEALKNEAFQPMMETVEVFSKEITEAATVVEALDETQQEMQQETIKISYNGKLLEIRKHKKEMIFVDIFDFIDFNRYELQGKLVLLHNGDNANYLEPLRDGDEVVVRWEK